MAFFKKKSVDTAASNGDAPSEDMAKNMIA